MLSNVFLFKERVYKLYKNDNDFINKKFDDISTREKRFSFATTDFAWNQQLSKEIYLRLQGVRAGAELVHFVDSHADAEELLLVTARLQKKDSVFEHLRAADLSEPDYYEIGKQFAERESRFVPYEAMSGESLLKNMLRRHHDLVEWSKGVEAHLPAEERDSYAGQVKSLIERVYTGDSTPLATSFDIHSLNAFYFDGIFHPFDIYAINDSWHFAPASVNMYRLATDVFALAGEKEFRAVVRGYYDYLGTKSPEKDAEQLMVIYSAFIMVSYLYMLSQTDAEKREVAIKYHDFLKRYTSGTLVQ